MIKLILKLIIGGAVLAALPASAEIKIGWIGPLTGNAAILGVDTIPAIQIAFDAVNAAGGIGGEKLRLVIEDDQYETAKTVSAYNRLVHVEGIKVIYILTYGGLFAVAPRAQSEGVLLLDPLDCDEAIAKLPSNTLCIAKTTEALGAMLAQQIIKNNEAPPAILYFDGDPFMGTAAQAVIDELKRHEIEPSYVETHNDATDDFKSSLAKIKALPQTKSLVLLGYDRIGLAAKQARSLGINLRFYGVNTVTSPGFLALAGDAAEGILGSAFRAERTPSYLAFIAEFKQRVGREPNFETSTIPAYDTARLLAQSLTRSGFDQTGKVIKVENLRAEFIGVKDYSGLSGTITIDPDGITRSIKVHPVILSRGSFLPIGEQ